MESSVHYNMDGDNDDVCNSKPSSDLSATDKNFLKVVVRMKDIDTKTVSFLRLYIPMMIINEKLEKIRRDPCNMYMRHHHGYKLQKDPITVDLNANGPFTTTFPLRHSSFGAIASIMYCFLRRFPSYLSCDFSQPLPKWKATEPFPTRFHIVYFELMASNGKLHVLGFNNPSDELSGKIFDPSNRKWLDLKLPIAVGRSDLGRIVAAPAGQNMLLFDVMNHLQYEYDARLSRWISTHHHGKLSHFGMGMGKPVTVEDEKIIYWIQDDRVIRAFDWAHSKAYEGPIVGFTHVDYDPLKRPELSSASPFLHLKKELFCVIWTEGDITLHLTILRVSRRPSCELPSDSVHPLHVTVVDCFHYRLDSMVMVYDAYKF